MLKAVMFDLDDTLYYELDYVKEAFGSVAEYLGTKYSLPAETILHSCMQILQTEGRGRIFNRVCEQYGMQEEIGHLLQIYRATKPRLQLYPEAVSLLRQLRDHSIRTGVITDGIAMVQRAKTEALFPGRMPDAVLLTDEVRDADGRSLSKPDPQVYLLCLQQLGAGPQEAVYVGDNPGKDFIGARHLGIKTVRVIHAQGDHIHDTARQGYEADLVLHRLPEVEELQQLTDPSER